MKRSSSKPAKKKYKAFSCFSFWDFIHRWVETWARICAIVTLKFNWYIFSHFLSIMFQDIIQKGRNSMRLSGRAKSTRCQAIEAWALYQSKWPIHSLPKENTFARGLLPFTWAILGRLSPWLQSWRLTDSILYSVLRVLKNPEQDWH